MSEKREMPMSGMNLEITFREDRFTQAGKPRLLVYENVRWYELSEGMTDTYKLIIAQDRDITSDKRETIERVAWLPRASIRSIIERFPNSTTST